MLKIKIILILFMFSSLVFSQGDSLTVKYDDSKLEVQQIGKEDIKKYLDDDRFNYSEVIEESTFLNKIVLWFRNLIEQIAEWLFGVGSASGVLKFIFEVLPYLILGFLVFLLLRFFLKVDSNNAITLQPNPSKVQFTEDEEIIKNEDISSLITEAIRLKDYRLAIRYYYLLSLKKLSENQIITWQQQKTNEDYIHEIQERQLKIDFSNITRIYDYVWYGEFNIDAIKFETLKLPFESLNNMMKS